MHYYILLNIILPFNYQASCNIPLNINPPHTISLTMTPQGRHKCQHPPFAWRRSAATDLLRHGALDGTPDAGCRGDLLRDGACTE